MNTNQHNSDLRSIGQLCTMLQMPISVIDSLAEELSMSPAVRLNGVKYFNATQVKQLTGRAQKAAAASKPQPAKGAGATKPGTKMVAASKDARAECRRFIEAFGDHGARYFAEGLTFAQAKVKHSQDIIAENERLKKQVQELKALRS